MARRSAEMGAGYLCAEAGISNAVICNQAGYVAGWLKKLRDDRRLLIHAAAQAQRAAGDQRGELCFGNRAHRVHTR